MNIFVFYFKGNEVNAYSREELTLECVKKLERNGFKRIKKKFSAENKEEAIKELGSLLRDDAVSMEEFTRDISASSLSAIFESLFR